MTAGYDDAIAKHFAVEVDETTGVSGSLLGANSPLRPVAESGWRDNVFGDAEPDGMPLIGGWFDAADLPKVARDHLYGLTSTRVCRS